MRFRGLSYVVAGLVFLLVNIAVAGFDLLPDFVGYTLILAGLATLRWMHTAFARAVPCAALLLVLNLWTTLSGLIDPAPGVADISLVAPAVPEGWTAAWSWVGFAVMLVGVLLGMALRWLLGQGMETLLAARGLFEDARATRRCARCNAAVLPLALLSALTPHMLLTVLFIAPGLVCSVWQIVRIRRNRKLLEMYPILG